MSENNPIAQEGEVLITDENMCDRQNRDLTGMEAVLFSELFNMDTDPVKIEKKHEWIFCKCGNIVIESPANQYRCGSCGNIKYDKKEV
jgi:ribosomal protein S27AE